MKLSKGKLKRLKKKLFSKKSYSNDISISQSGGKSTLNINGKTYKGNSSIQVKNGDVYIDGYLVEEGNYQQLKIYGSAGQVVCDGSIECNEVEGNIDAGGSIECDDVKGDVMAGGSVSCDNVGGRVTAGGSINCN